MSVRRERIILLLIIGLPLLLSTLSGLNNLFGFFAAISFSTAIISGVLALVVAIFFPTLLRSNWPKDQTPPANAFLLAASVLLGLSIFAFGTGPFLIKWRLAALDKAVGREMVDLHRYGAAEVPAARAARYFEEIGLTKASADANIVLMQVYAGIGDFSKARELLEEVEASGALDAHMGGKLHAVRGELAYQRADFEQAEREFQLALQTIEPGSQPQAAVLQNLGVLWSAKGGPFRERASEHYKQAEQIYRELGDNIGLTNILVNEGALLESEPESARALYEQAQVAAAEIGDAYILGTIALNIGFTYRQTDALDEAEQSYVEARIRFEEAADLAGQAQVELNMAVVDQIRGNIELARQHLNASEAYLRNVDPEDDRIPPRTQAQLLTFQADLYDLLGQSADAETRYMEALAIYARHPDPLREATTLVNYAGLLARLNRGGEARSFLGRAREIAEAFTDEGPHRLFIVLYNNLGRTYQDISDNEAALSYYEQAREMARSMGERLQYAQAVENIGVIYSYAGDTQQANASFEEALAIYRQLGNRDREVQALFNLYSNYVVVGDPAAAETVSELLALLQEHHIDREVEAGVLFGILIQDIGENSDLITYRERLRQLRVFYEQLEEPIGLGRSHQKLAAVEQSLGNLDEMIRHAREAERYVAEIPLPARFLVHSDLGFFLLPDSAEDALSHFHEAFDLAQNYEVTQQRNMALVINLYTIIYASELDCPKHLGKARTVVRDTADAEIQFQFQEIIDVLSPICG